ncbi:MAG TPA: hypothetical protein HA367_04215 [Candidatus Methanofastidiosum sp.]|nr:hypothetical protein [Methanofastidiosum sp.]
MFKDKRLLEKAITHESVKGTDIFERTFENLKNLGDKILGYIVWDNFYEELEKKRITKAEVKVYEDNPFLFGIVKSHGLERYLKHTIKNIEGHKREELWGNLMESIIAAIYLDSNRDIEKVKYILKNNLKIFEKNEKGGVKRGMTSLK